MCHDFKIETPPTFVQIDFKPIPTNPKLTQRNPKIAHSHPKIKKKEKEKMNGDIIISVRTTISLYMWKRV